MSELCTGAASELCCKSSYLITLFLIFQVNVTVDYIRPASPATDTVPAFQSVPCATVSLEECGVHS